MSASKEILAVCVIALSLCVIGCELSSKDPSAPEDNAGKITPQDVGYAPNDLYSADSEVEMTGTLQRRRDTGEMILETGKGKVALKPTKKHLLDLVKPGTEIVVYGTWARDDFGRPVINVARYQGT